MKLHIIALIVFAAAISCSSAATIFMESGSDATQDFSFFTSTGGTVTSDSAAAITGPRSIKMATASAAQLNKNGIMADAGRRLTFRYKATAFPTTTAFSFCNVQTAGSVQMFGIQQNANGTLGLQAAGSGITSGTTVLVVNQAYRLALAYTVTSTTVFSVKLYINGKQEVSISNTGTLTTVSSANARWLTSTNVATGNFLYFDDIFIDDGTDLGDPGNIIVTAKRPFAAGAANAWTTQIGTLGSGYGSGHALQVNEQPLSTTNGWSITSASLLTEEYTIEGASVGDTDVSNPRKFRLVDYMGWVFAKTGTAGTRNIIVGGAASNISVTTAYALYTKAAGSTVYPSTNAAIGMNNNSSNVLDSLAECGVLLAYRLPRRIDVGP